MMDTAFEGQRLQASFTFRIVEAVKRIKINPMPRLAGLPWGLSLTVGVLFTVLSLNPQISIIDTALPTGSPLTVEAKVLKTGEIPVDILKTSEISVIASKQGDGDGGRPNLQELQNAFMLAPQAEGGTWTKKADMPTPRFELSASVVDGIVYAIGGNDKWGADSKFFSVVEAYNPETDIWETKADMPTPRSWFCTAVVDGKIYAMGGDRARNQTTSLMEEYDPATDTWTKKRSMPSSRGSVGAAVVNGKMYVIGGYRGVSSVRTVEMYDPVTDTWTRKADMPTARWGPVVASQDGLIYAMGGETTFDTGSRAMEVYDPATDKWTKKADIPQWVGVIWSSGKAAVVNGRFYTRASAGFVSYDPAMDTFTKEPDDMPNPRRNTSIVAVNNSIYIIGGTAIGGAIGLAGVDQFTPASTSDTATFYQDKLPTKWGEVKSE